MGLKTSYQEFFSHYLSIPSDDDDIVTMKHDIQSHRYLTWADLEMGLGEYSINCKNKDIFLKCLVDIKKSLKDYIEGEAVKINQLEISSLAPIVSLGSLMDPEPEERFSSFINQLHLPVYIDVITFNYTTTLEFLFGYKGNDLDLTRNVVLRSINHVHGTLGEMMVMGVNDENQISNESFRSDLDIKEDFIKPEYNDACENNKNYVCENLIEKADVIVFYGSSLGLTDNKWWKQIGGRMNDKNYPLLVYLPYDVNKNQALEPNRIRRWTFNYVSEIKQKFGITISEEVLRNRICVAVNKRLIPVRKSSKKAVST